MDGSKFVLLSAAIDADQWPRIGPSFDKYQMKYTDGIILVDFGIWLIDRTIAEVALTYLIEHLHRIGAPFVVAPLSHPLTIAASEDVLQKVVELEIDAYPMPFAK